ncbi:MAG: AAA family ATPase [Myxococcota bacterium]
MIIETLHLLAYGNFTDRRLELGSTGHRFHLLYGPNEAGKSTTLRAILALLFGFPRTTPDAFFHGNDKLRVGARLSLHAGLSRWFVRRKGNKSTLLDENGQTLPDESLRPFLPGQVTEDLFEHQFGLNHARLIEGGKSLLAGKGAVDQALFAASTGLNGVQELQTRFSNEADLLFKPQGRSGPSLTRMLREREDKRKERDGLLLRANDYTSHDQARAEAEQKLTAVQQNILTVETSLQRTQRIQAALPSFQKRREHLTELEPLREIPSLSRDFSERRARAYTEQTQAHTRLQQLEQALQQCLTQLETLVVPTHLLERSAEIETSHMQLGEFIKGERDLPNLRDKLEGGELHQARHLLRELGLPADLDAGRERLNLSKARRENIRTLGQEHKARTEAVRTAERQGRGIADELAQKQQALDQLPAPPDTTLLRDALERARRAGNLEEQLRLASEELDKMRRTLGLELERLGLFQGTLEQLQRLPLPDQERVASFESRSQKLELELERLKKEQEQLRQSQLSQQRELKALELGGEVPTEADLLQARAHRQALWQALKTQWESGAPFDSTQSFEQQVELTDTLADRLRREAERVQRKVQLQVACEALTTQLEQLTHETLRQEQMRAALEQAWQGCWQETQLSPRAPREMKGWLSKALALQEKATRPAEQEEKVHQLRQRVEEHRGWLLRALETLQVVVPEQERLESLVTRTEQVLEQWEQQRRQRQKLREGLDELVRKQRLAQQEEQQAQRDLEQWQKLWGDAVAVLGLTQDALPSTANQMLSQAEEFMKHLQEADGFRKRIQGIERDKQQLQEKVAELCMQVAPELLDQALRVQVERLHARLKEAEIHRTQQQTLLKERKKLEGERLNTQQALEQATRQLDGCLLEARCERYADLADCEAQAARKAELLQHERTLRDQLLNLAEGQPLEQWLELLGQTSMESVKAQRTTLEQQKAELELARDLHTRTLAQEQTLLRQHQGGDRALQLTEEYQALTARMKEEAEQYLFLRLSQALLQHELTSWREKHQNPLLRRASELFRRLTGGRYQALRTDYAEDDTPHLVGERGELKVSVEAMSEGTRDQLFLALRLASLEQFLRTTEPVPLIVDDLLINFDDTRSAETLKVLQTISAQTQVLFFTHHPHLIRLAQAVLPSGSFQALEL